MKNLNTNPDIITDQDFTCPSCQSNDIDKIKITRGNKIIEIDGSLGIQNYHYRCGKCGKIGDTYIKLTNDIKCPRCGSADIDKNQYNIKSDDELRYRCLKCLKFFDFQNPKKFPEKFSESDLS
jgi:DNA-directed RNA polymerase subunit RPC12/RpoP